jgi:exodeoxyribonuclease VII large subunit
VVVARGGGSLEDLWAFNEEVVARALAACPVPTVSAVGHEVDVTIADFVADARAATPTAAAELLAKVKHELIEDLGEKRARLVRAMRGKLEQRRSSLESRRSKLLHPRALLSDRRLLLDRLEQRGQSAVKRAIDARAQALQRVRDRLERAHPAAHLHRLHNEVSQLQQRLNAAVHRLLGQRRQQFEVRVGRLDAMSPLRVLARGYAVAFDASGHAVRDAAEVNPGSSLRLRLARGELDAQVTSVRPADGGRSTSARAEPDPE